MWIGRKERVGLRERGVEKAEERERRKSEEDRWEEKGHNDFSGFMEIAPRQNPVDQEGMILTSKFGSADAGITQKEIKRKFTKYTSLRTGSKRALAQHLSPAHPGIWIALCQEESLVSVYFFASDQTSGHL